VTWHDLVINLRLDVLGLLSLAALLGGAVGMERELQGKPAGLRTNILICIGACLFTVISRGFTPAGAPGDPARVAAQIVTGVGFIGAGTILRTRGAISGLTSAATIWVVAAIGMAVGVGWAMEASGATLLLVLVLAVLGRFERYLDRRVTTSRLTLQVQAGPHSTERIEELVVQAGARVEWLRATPEGDQLTVDLRIRGPRHVCDRAKLSVLRATGTWNVTDLDRAAETGSGES